MTIRVLCTAALVLACALPAAAQKKTAKQAARHGDEAAAIAKVSADYQAAYSRHDAKAAAALYATDGDRRTIDGRVVKGRANIEHQLADDFNGRFKNAVVKFDPASDVRFMSPTLVIVDGSAQLSGVATANGQPMPAQKYFHTLVLVKRAGSWQILALRNWPAPAN